MKTLTLSSLVLSVCVWASAATAAPRPAVLGGVAPAQVAMDHAMMSADMQKCMDNCTECHQVCVQMVEHCLKMGGVHASADHIKLLQDCAQICQTSADFLARDSERHAWVCGVCAEICKRCGEQCERMAGSDAMMKQCAEVCRRCEQSCREMSKKAS